MKLNKNANLLNTSRPIAGTYIAGQVLKRNKAHHRVLLILHIYIATRSYM